MRIKLTSIMVNDQAKAQKFYTDVLGFRTKDDFPVGEYRWITVVSPEGPDDLQGIPIAAFEVRDLAAEFDRLKNRGVAFVKEPMSAGPVQIAIFSDACGNLIQLYQLA